MLELEGEREINDVEIERQSHGRSNLTSMEVNLLLSSSSSNGATTGTQPHAGNR